MSTSSSHLITEIAKSCNTQVLQVLVPVLLLKDVVSLKNQLTELKFVIDIEENQTAVNTLMPFFLHNNCTLKVLELYGKTRLCDASIEALATGLKNNHVLKKLKLAGYRNEVQRQKLRKGYSERRIIISAVHPKKSVV